MSSPEEDPPAAEAVVAVPVDVVLKPALVEDEDVIHKSLPQWVPTATGSAAGARAWLSADARARRHRRPLPGYSNDQVADIEERAAKAMRVRPEGLRQHGSKRTRDAAATKRKWNRDAELLWPGRYKDQVVDIMVERTGVKRSTVYRALKRLK